MAFPPDRAESRDRSVDRKGAPMSVNASGRCHGLQPMNARLINRILACVVALTLAVPPLLPAQTAPPAPAQAAPPLAPFKAEELDQIAAPIALYPDPLVAQVLMASTYPLEIVQAARFMKDNPSLTGDPLAQALQGQTWDDSVKSLITFPQVLSMMDSKLDWTQKLGDAFLAQQKDLMDAIQRLRAKAQASGNLKSSAEQTVTVEPAEAAPAPPPPPVAGQPAPAPQQVIVSRRRRRSSRSCPRIRRSSTSRRTIRPSSTERGPTRLIRRTPTTRRATWPVGPVLLRGRRRGGRRPLG